MQEAFDFNDTLVRFGVFAGLFILFAAIEFFLPRRQLVASKGRRWFTNLGISVTAGLLLRLMAALAVPLTAIAAALYAQQKGLGLLNAVDWPDWLKIVIALLVLDLAIWAQHLASHRSPSCGGSIRSITPTATST
nr:hypothetical protein [Methyloceanibacter stevinii]